MKNEIKKLSFYDRACEHLRSMAELPDGRTKHWPVPNDFRASAEEVAAALRKAYFKSWDYVRQCYRPAPERVRVFCVVLV